MKFVFYCHRKKNGKIYIVKRLKGKFIGIDEIRKSGVSVHACACVNIKLERDFLYTKLQVNENMLLIHTYTFVHSGIFLYKFDENWCFFTVF